MFSSFQVANLKPVLARFWRKFIADECPDAREERLLWEAFAAGQKLEASSLTPSPTSHSDPSCREELLFSGNK